MTSLTLTTELEAINEMLRCIGESPVNSLVSSSVDVANAKAVLDSINREVQMKGWSFNREENFTLTPDPITKKINLPANCVKVDTVGKDESIKVTQRGTLLYDPVKHTYEWEQSLLTELIILLPFDELPQHARHYIMVKAARKFQTGAVGDQLLYSYTKQDETDAETAFKDMESEGQDHNILTGSIGVAQILQR